MIDINKFLIEYKSIIYCAAYKYHSNFNIDDFKQELMIDVWHHMQKYDVTISDSPKAFLLSFIDVLAKRVLTRFINDKNRRLNDSFVELVSDRDVDIIFAHHLVELHEDTEFEPLDILEINFTELEKRIIYSIDYDHLSNNTYVNIAKRMGIPTRMFYYHLKNIREKVNNALKHK